MKLKSFWAAVAATLLLGLFSTSCAPKEELAPELTLTTTTLQLDNKEQTKDVPVTTNQSSIEASATADWLEANASGTTVQIKVQANDEKTDRSADVLVFAGGLVKKIKVVQSAADIVLEIGVNPEEKIVTNIEQEFLIAVKATQANWKAEVAEGDDWISITPFTSEIIQVAVTANKTEQVRNGKIIFSLGTKYAEVSIQQVGVSVIKWILPYLESTTPRLSDVILHESKQGNFLVTYQEGYEGWLGSSPGLIKFANSSPVFFETQYVLDVPSKGGAITDVVMRATSNEGLLDPEYRQFLTSNGFELSEAGEDGGYKGEKDAGTLLVKIQVSPTPDPKKADPGVIFTFTPKQNKAYPTFTSFPYDRSGYLFDKTPYATIKQTEVDEGATIEGENFFKNHPDKVETLQVTVAEKFRPVHTRLFFMGADDDGVPTDNLGELLTVWDNANLGAWEDANGKFHLTREFEELLAKEGFVFNRENRGMSYYHHAGKNLMIVPRGVRYSDVLDGAPVFSINFFEFVISGSSASNDDIEARIDAIAKKIIERDAQLGIR